MTLRRNHSCFSRLVAPFFSLEMSNWNGFQCHARLALRTARLQIFGSQQMQDHPWSTTQNAAASILASPRLRWLMQNPPVILVYVSNSHTLHPRSYTPFMHLHYLNMFQHYFNWFHLSVCNLSWSNLIIVWNIDQHQGLTDLLYSIPMTVVKRNECLWCKWVNDCPRPAVHRVPAAVSPPIKWCKWRISDAFNKPLLRLRARPFRFSKLLRQDETDRQQRATTPNNTMHHNMKFGWIQDMYIALYTSTRLFASEVRFLLKPLQRDSRSQGMAQWPSHRPLHLKPKWLSVEEAQTKLCKHRTCNPNNESCHKAWAL